MARIVRTFQVNRPIEDVFDAVADFSTAAEWDPGVATSSPGGGPRIGTGAEWNIRLAMGPLRVGVVYETTVHDRPHRVVHETRTWWAKGVDDVRFEQDGRTTQVTWQADFSLTGPGRLLDPLLQQGFEGVGDRAVTGLEAWLRAGGTGQRPDDA